MMIDGAVHVWDPTYQREGWTRRDLVAELDGSAIDGAICVQSRRDSGYDHNAVTRVLASDPNRFVGICIIEPETINPVHILSDFVGLGYKGLRILPYSESHAPWLVGRSGNGLWDAAAELDLPVDILCRPDQLEEVYERARQTPYVRIVIDHLGLVSADDHEDRHHALLRCAELSNVFVKMSALAYLSRVPFPYSDLYPLIQNVVTAFGAHRIVYGSDWPNILEYGPYLYGVAAIDNAIVLSSSDRRGIFGETARNLWSFDSMNDESTK